MAGWFNANVSAVTNERQLFKLGSDGSVTQWTANPGDNTQPNQGLNPVDLTGFNNAVWFNGETTGGGNQLFKLGADGSVTQWTSIHSGLIGLFAHDENPDLTLFNNALWFRGNNNATDGEQLYKLGSDGSVTKWTSIGAGLNDLSPHDLTVFNNALWFDGSGLNAGIYKLGNDGSVTKWTSGLGFTDPTVFNNALWFNGFNAGQTQLYKLGNDGSVTQWTASNPLGGGLAPIDFTPFNDALWFRGQTQTLSQELYKLGNDGSVTQWTASHLFPTNFTAFNNALWFNGFDSGAGQDQLYKLGSDGSVTKWTVGGLNPQHLTVFNDALWFTGQTSTHGQQLYKLGADGSVTQWTDIFGGAIPGGLNPIPVSTAASDADSTPLSVANNGLWFQGTHPTLGRELYKLGTDGSFTFWKDIVPGPEFSSPHDWALL
jgi:hypothetical protein